MDTDKTFNKIQNSYIIKRLNRQKPAVFLYASNGRSENEIKKTISLTIAHLGIHLMRWYNTYTLKTAIHCWKKLKDI